MTHEFSVENQPWSPHRFRDKPSLFGETFWDPWIIEMIGWLYGGVVAILHFNGFKVKQSQLLDWQNVPDG
jgi:hypothetical protein